MWYFAYGSNLCRGRLMERISSAPYAGVGGLAGYSFRFHKIGVDGSAKADAFRTGNPDDVVWGVLVEVDGDQLAVLDRFEPRYDRVEVDLALPERTDPAIAYTYVARLDAIDPSRLPFAWYQRLVVDGGAARGLPGAYLQDIAGRPNHVENPPWNKGVSC